MSSQRASPRPLGMFPLVMVVILVLATLAPAVWPDFSRLVTVSDIKPVSGIGFFAKLSDSTLSDDKVPTGAELYLIEAKRGTALHRLDVWCVPVRFACAWLNALIDSNYPGATHEVESRLGPGGSLHQDILEKGGAGFRCGRAASTSVCPTGFRLPA